MTVLECRRDRLVHVLDLARMYRGWTRQEVAAALGREPSKMIPDSGNPKLDLVMGIARLLEWPVGEVTACLWGDGGASQRPGPALEAAESLRREGRYLEAIETLQQALGAGGLPVLLRARLQATLADLHGTMGHLAEARALASDLLRWTEARADLLAPRVTALSVRGHALRRAIPAEPAPARAAASAALRDLELAERGACAAAMPGVGNFARGGLVECRVELGASTPDDAVAVIMDELDAVVDPDSVAPDMLESWGWWCIIGSTIARRHLHGSVAQRVLGILANKAMEIADRIDHWALRERAFVMDHDRRDDSGDDPVLLDHEDIRSIIGVMGRFPGFRPTGWSLLRRAVVVE